METIISGRRLAYDLVGQQGVPVVLLHPFPLDRRALADLGGRLARRARVVLPDLRGFGESEQGGPFSIADLADDVAALLDALGISRAVVGGVSMGGYVSLAFAARHGKRMSGLVLADTKAGPDTPETRAARDEAIALVRAEGVAAYVERQLPRLLAPTAPDELRAQVRGLGGQRPEAVVAGLEALRDRPDRRGELGAIACPTLVLVGAQDVLTPPAEATALATAVPDAILMELPDVGHFAHLEAPAPFAQAIGGFLARIPA
jgi:pimeloyl-ACP methyl ester carboxylesterase